MVPAPSRPHAVAYGSTTRAGLTCKQHTSCAWLPVWLMAMNSARHRPPAQPLARACLKPDEPATGVCCMAELCCIAWTHTRCSLRQAAARPHPIQQVMAGIQQLYLLVAHMSQAGLSMNRDPLCLAWYSCQHLDGSAISSCLPAHPNAQPAQASAPIINLSERPFHQSAPSNRPIGLSDGSMRASQAHVASAGVHCTMPWLLPIPTPPSPRLTRLAPHHLT